MSILGWYYLHTNGDLIFKQIGDGVLADIRDSDFARGLWPCDPQNRATAWTTLIEAKAAGADAERVAHLATKWHCDDADALIYAERVGCKVYRTGSAWCARRGNQESPAGFGDTALDAMSELCNELGYRPAKMWGTSFGDLLAAERAAHPTDGDRSES